MPLTQRDILVAVVLVELGASSLTTFDIRVDLSSLARRTGDLSIAASHIGAWNSAGVGIQLRTSHILT